MFRFVKFNVLLMVLNLFCFMALAGGQKQNTPPTPAVPSAADQAAYLAKVAQGPNLGGLFDASGCSAIRQKEMTDRQAGLSTCKRLAITVNNAPQNSKPAKDGNGRPIPEAGGNVNTDKMSLTDCARELNKCDATGDDGPDGTNEDSLGDETGDDPDDRPTYCKRLDKQTLANYLGDKVKDLKSDMKDTHSTLNDAQDKIADATKNEQETEQALQEKITKATQDLQDAQGELEKELNGSDDKAEKDILDLKDKLQKLQAALAKIAGPDRNAILTQYNKAVRSAKSQCAKDVASRAANNTLTANTLSAVLASTQTGAVKYQCGKTRDYLYTMQQAEEEKEVAVQQNQAAYAQMTTEVTDATNRIQARLTAYQHERGQGQSDFQRRVQKDQTDIQSSSYQLLQAQKSFQAKLQQLNQRMQTAQQEDKQQTANYSSASKELSDLRAHKIYPKSGDTAADNLAADAKIVSDAAALDDPQYKNANACPDTTAPATADAPPQTTKFDPGPFYKIKK